MPLTAILGLGAGLCYALSHFLVRLGLGRSNPSSAVAVNVAVNALGLWVLALLFSPIRPLASLAAWPFILAGLFAPSLARILLYRGIARMGLARSAALVGAMPLFAVSIAVIFLGERPSPGIITGAVLVVLGVAALNASRISDDRWAKWTILLPLGAALCFALRDIFTKSGLRDIPLPLAGAALVATTSVVAFYLIFLVSKNREKILLPWRSFWLFSGAGLLVCVSYVLLFIALNQDMVSLVSPLVATNPLVSVILSYLFLQTEEKVSLKVVLGGVLVVAGAISISLG